MVGLRLLTMSRILAFPAFVLDHGWLGHVVDLYPCDVGYCSLLLQKTRLRDWGCCDWRLDRRYHFPAHPAAAFRERGLGVGGSGHGIRLHRSHGCC